MFAHIMWALLVLGCAATVSAQDLLYDFTMGVTSPAPVPGKPFTFTWTGGESTEAVYIVLNGYFEPDPNANIIYTRTDILSNAPNNGSWTWTVPLDITAGRHSFSIGYNPLQLSDTTDIFTILSTQSSYVAPGPATSNTAAWTYNGCGLAPLPDYTYTGYQPPCTTTISGRVETLYPIVPASDSSSFYSGATSAPASTTQPTSTSAASALISSASATFNTAFATGIFAQALQCPAPVTPSRTTLTASSGTTIFSVVGCTPSTSRANLWGVCHTSGYTTFSVSGSSSVCCPNGWVTTPLNSEFYCFTSMGEAKRGVLGRQVSTETLAQAPYTEVEIQGLAFTSAGVVTEALIGMGSSSTASGSSSISVSTATTGSAASASATKSPGVKLDLGIWRTLDAIAAMAALYYLV